MKPSLVMLIAIAILMIGFTAGIFLSSFRTNQKLALKREQLDYLIRLHDSYRNDLKRAYTASDTVLNKIFPLITDGTLTSKGKVSSDPIKRLLWESYHSISGNMAVLRGYDQQVYPQDSAFLKKCSMINSD